MHPLHHTLLVILGFSQCIVSVHSVPEQQLIIPPSTGVASSIKDALRYSSIISDVLDDFEPSHSVSITYPKSHESVQLGNDIPVGSVTPRPAFEFHAMSIEGVGPDFSNKTFTLILTDPDATSRDNPTLSEMCHWVLTNLTAPVTDGAKVTEKDELVEYLPPTPPPKTGKHRYVFVLLEGQQGQNLSPPKDRKHWGYQKVRHGVRDWAKENRLSVIGANFFYAEDPKQ